jgi:hypothetical protein
MSYVILQDNQFRWFHYKLYAKYRWQSQNNLIKISWSPIVGLQIRFVWILVGFHSTISNNFVQVSTIQKYEIMFCYVYKSFSCHFRDDSSNLTTYGLTFTSDLYQCDHCNLRRVKFNNRYNDTIYINRDKKISIECSYIFYFQNYQHN